MLTAPAESYLDLYRYITAGGIRAYRRFSIDTHAWLDRKQNDLAYMGLMKNMIGYGDPRGGGFFIECPGEFGNFTFFVAKSELVKHKDRKNDALEKSYYLGNKEILFFLPQFGKTTTATRIGIFSDEYDELVYVHFILREHELRKHFSELEQAAQEHFHRLEEQRRQMRKQKEAKK